jgi:hypothetical protein
MVRPALHADAIADLETMFCHPSIVARIEGAGTDVSRTFMDLRAARRPRRAASGGQSGGALVKIWRREKIELWTCPEGT